MCIYSLSGTFFLSAFFYFDDLVDERKESGGTLSIMTEVTKTFYTSFAGNVFTVTELYFLSYEVETNIGLLFDRKIYESEYGYEKMRVDTFGALKDGETNFLKIILNRSQIKTLYKRNYRKVSEIAAEIGGFTKVCLIVGEVFTYFIKEILYRNYLLSFFYEKINIQFKKRSKSLNFKEGAIVGESVKNTKKPPTKKESKVGLIYQGCIKDQQKK